MTSSLDIAPYTGSFPLKYSFTGDKQRRRVLGRRLDRVCIEPKKKWQVFVHNIIGSPYKRQVDRLHRSCYLHPPQEQEYERKQDRLPFGCSVHGSWVLSLTMYSTGTGRLGNAVVR